MIDFEKGIIHRGLWGPIRRCMEKAERGEDITVAFLGGSITQGSLASSPETCYAYRVYSWWKDAFPQANIRYINAGIGGTGSYFGVARVDEHVLRYEPDFLLTEFAVNDDGMDHGTPETYEGLIRRILSAPKAPALMLMHNVCYDTGHNAEEFHLPVAQHYDLPCVSMKYTIYPEVAEGRIPNRDITPDDLHPNDAGHDLVAQGIICLLEKIRAWNGNEMPGNLPSPLYSDEYQNTVLLQNHNSTCELAGFEADLTPQNHITETFRRGFTAWKAGDSITFRVKGRAFGVLYRKSVQKPAPVAQITVDGFAAFELDANFQETWGDCTYMQRCCRGYASIEHTVTITIEDTGVEPVVPFYLIGLVVSDKENPNMFPEDFVWGCASSAYQIEGGWNEGGRGPSIWDTFCHEGGHVYENHTGDVACDFFHRYKEDIAIMAQMGVQAYRFSLSWSRILPEGVGRVNEEGIAFYNAVIDELIANGIKPYITLYHWDYPQALQDRGGWLNEESIGWFAEYAGVVSAAFSDRVEHFITLNEPQCFTGIAHLHTDHAPGIRFTQKQMFQMVHNVLRAHGAGVIALRANAVRPIQVGYAPTCGMVYPKTETPENIEACRRYLFSCPDNMENWTWNVPWFSDPVFLGEYPADGLKKYAEYLPVITEEDMKLISQPLDFMGENIYNGIMLEADENGNPVYVDRAPGFPITGNDWPVTPECFRWGLKFLYERYKMPIYVTENGICCRDFVSSDGRVHDPQRIDFLNRYILAMRKAMHEGADIRGYFEWTLTDNFEWNFGFRDKFGLVYVDFVTQRRIRKDSSYWYADVIKTRGDSLVVEEKPEFYSELPEGVRKLHDSQDVLKVTERGAWLLIESGYGTLDRICVKPGDVIKLPESMFGILDGHLSSVNMKVSVYK